MGPRVTFVGGGSTHWTPKLLVDFANTPSLQDAHVTLVDIDAGSLPPMLEVAEHIVKQRDIGLTVDATTNLAEGLDGTQFVISAFTVGGFASMKHDLDIPARYGIRQTVGDSIGPGGIMRALRSVPVTLEMARTVEQHAPDALMVNVSNPLTALTRCVNRETNVRAVGLCNELVGMKYLMSLLLDTDMMAVDPTVAGVNHLPLVTALKLKDGSDGFAQLRELLERFDADPTDPVLQTPLWMDPPDGMHFRKHYPGERWTKADLMANLPLKLEIFRRFGVIAGSSDTHVCEFFPWFVTARSDFGRDWNVHHYGLAGHMADKVIDDASVGGVLGSEEISTFPSGELVATLLDGIVTGTEVALPVNLPNTGQVTSLPADVVVECIGVTGSDGVRARDTAGVSGVMGEALRRVSASQELTVEAAISGNRTTVLEAMLADPVAGALPYETVTLMTDQLLDALAPWLPKFRS